jgi:hypothetical protein
VTGYAKSLRLRKEETRRGTWLRARRQVNATTDHAGRRNRCIFKEFLCLPVVNQAYGIDVAIDVDVVDLIHSALEASNKKQMCMFLTSKVFMVFG